MKNVKLYVSATCKNPCNHAHCMISRQLCARCREPIGNGPFHIAKESFAAHDDCAESHDKLPTLT